MAWDVFIPPLVAQLCRLVCGTRSPAIQKYSKPADRVACTAARDELPATADTAVSAMSEAHHAVLQA
jgi:hypothetical protein